MRWALFLGLLVFAVAILAPLPSLLGTPDPGAQCDPAAVFQDQLLRAATFGQWTLRQMFILAAIVGMGTFAAFYLQIFHFSLGGWGSLARILLVTILGLVAGWQLMDVAGRWVLRQRTLEGPSCLLQALNTSASQRVSLLTGRWLLPPPNKWPLALRLDMTILVVLGVLFGVASYSLLRRLRRL